MSRALLAALVLGAATAPLGSAPRAQLCLPEPPRTVPHGHLDRVDKWQNDERTIA